MPASSRMPSSSAERRSPTLQRPLQRSEEGEAWMKWEGMVGIQKGFGWGVGRKVAREITLGRVS